MTETELILLKMLAIFTGSISLILTLIFYFAKKYKQRLSNIKIMGSCVVISIFLASFSYINYDYFLKTYVFDKNSSEYKEVALIEKYIKNEYSIKEKENISFLSTEPLIKNIYSLTLNDKAKEEILSIINESKIDKEINFYEYLKIRRTVEQNIY